MDIEPLTRVFVTTQDAARDGERTVAGLVTSYEPTDDGFNITATMFPRGEQPWFYEGPVWETREDAEDNAEGHPNVAYLEPPAPPAPATPRKRAAKSAPKAGDEPK